MVRRVPNFRSVRGKRAYGSVRSTGCGQFGQWRLVCALNPIPTCQARGRLIAGTQRAFMFLICSRSSSNPSRASSSFSLCLSAASTAPISHFLRGARV